MPEYDFYRGWCLPSNVVLTDFYLNFSMRTFWQVNDGKKMQTTVKYEVRICYRMAPLRMLYLMTLTHVFKVTNFEMWISRKRWELSQNVQLRFFIEVDIFHRLRMLYSMTLTWFFQDQNFQMAILTSKRWTMQTSLLPSNSKSDICHRMAPLRMLYSGDLDLHFHCQTFQTLISPNRCELG